MTKQRITNGDQLASERLTIELWQRQHACRDSTSPTAWAYPGTRYKAPDRSSRWVWLAVVVVLCLLVAGAAKAQTIGLNILSLHERGGYRAATPGVYVILPEPVLGLNTAGILRNSIGRTSVQLGRTWTSQPFAVFGLPVHDAAVSVGGISGYPHATVSPYIVPSVRIGKVRAMWLERKPDEPNSSRALHFALEF